MIRVRGGIWNPIQLDSMAGSILTVTLFGIQLKTLTQTDNWFGSAFQQPTGRSVQQQLPQGLDGTTRTRSLPMKAVETFQAQCFRRIKAPLYLVKHSQTLISVRAQIQPLDRTQMQLVTKLPMRFSMKLVEVAPRMIPKHARQLRENAGRSAKRKAKMSTEVLSTIGS